MKDNDNRQIGDVAKTLGVTTRTIRYYEELGIMEPVERIGKGVRVYSCKDVKRLKFVLKLKELGLSLKEISMLARYYYSVNQDVKKAVPMVLQMLDQHVHKIDEKIDKLASLRREISATERRLKA